MNNQKKTALVIGGSGGIGSAIVTRLRSDGMQVFSTYHRRRAPGDDPSALAMDVANASSVDKALQIMLKECAQIDVVVYAVSAPIKHTPILNLSWQELEAHLAAQLQGFFHVVQGLRADISAKKNIKFIVLLSEVCVGRPPSRLAHYTSAKYAFMGFAKTAAVELGRYGSTVNMISPGMVATDLIAAFPPKAVEMAASENPLGRIATPDDVASVVAFLASDEAAYLNGVNILVNGGEVMV